MAAVHSSIYFLGYAVAGLSDEAVIAGSSPPGLVDTRTKPN